MQPAKHFFPGGNTGLGFVSHFDDLLPLGEARRIIVLKGGPGVGKSTLMKRVGKALEQAGEAVEYAHCASDPESLDAVVCPARGFMILDGTSPHVIDPVLPGAVDCIINLGALLDEAALAQRRQEIEEAAHSMRQWFAAAHDSLRAAATLMCAAQRVWDAVLDRDALAQLVLPWLDTLVSHRAQAMGAHTRTLFAEAFTPAGRIHYLETLVLPRLFRITGPWGYAPGPVLALLAERAAAFGLSCTRYQDALLPHQPAHVCVEALELFITAERRTDVMPVVAERTIDVRRALPTELAPPLARQLAFLEMQHEQLTRNAMDALAHAKRCHDALEACYGAAMDYSGLDGVYERIETAYLA